MSGKITTHVLNLAQGIPAQGVKVELYDSAKQALLATAITNADGRVDQPLLSGEDIQAGVYELIFYVGDYHRDIGTSTEETLLWEQVPLRFHIVDTEQNYHIPLLVAPGGYSTYRGS